MTSWFNAVILAAVLCVLSLTMPVLAQAEKRVALVVGNSSYTGMTPLNNPKNDATDVAASLERLGFEVLLKFDLGKHALSDALEEFADKATDADMGLVFFAGHGMAVNKTNYLIPVDANLETDRKVRFQTIRLDEVLASLDDVRGIKLVILDACRNNIFRKPMRITRPERTALQRGFYRAEPDSGTLVSFSARDGSTAADGRGRNSPYTEALLKHLEQPGLELNFLFRKVRDAVIASTNARQEPHTYGSLPGKAIYFRAKAQVAKAEIELERWKRVERFVASARRDVDRTRTRITGDYKYIGEKLSEIETRLKEFGTAADSSEVKKRLAAVAGWVAKQKELPAIGASVGSDADVVRLREENTRLREQNRQLEQRIKEPRDTKVAVGVPQPPRCAGTETTVAGKMRCLRAGATFRDCADCPEMVVLPAGKVLIGSPSKERQRDDDEGPRREVAFREAFAVGKFEVTFEEWDKCVAQDGCNGYRPKSAWGRGRQPVTSVSWNDAQAYIAWLGRKSGQTYRLLTESEWEYAARAGSQSSFSTGQTITTDQANFDGRATYNGSKKGIFRKRTLEVGQFSANRFGVHDMHGNVWEVTADCYISNYKSPPISSKARLTKDCVQRVLRGGSWFYPAHVLRAANRSRLDVSTRSDEVGFRVARSLNHSKP